MKEFGDQFHRLLCASPSRGMPVVKWRKDGFVRAVLALPGGGVVPLYNYHVDPSVGVGANMKDYVYRAVGHGASRISLADARELIQAEIDLLLKEVRDRPKILAAEIKKSVGGATQGEQVPYEWGRYGLREWMLAALAGVACIFHPDGGWSFCLPEKALSEAKLPLTIEDNMAALRAAMSECR